MLVDRGSGDSVHREQACAQAALLLSRGDAVQALSLVGTLDDAKSLLLRGIAYAQMGDLDLARKTLLRTSKMRGAAAPDALTIARVAAAQAEIELAAGKASAALRSARLARATLERLGDHQNAATQHLVEARALVLLGDLDGAWRAISDVPKALSAVSALVRAEVATRRLEATVAMRALSEAARSDHGLLVRAAVAMSAELRLPIARLSDRGNVHEVALAGVEAAMSGTAFLVDQCRRVVRAGRTLIPLARRPVLFDLLFALASSWPEGVGRDDLARRAFAAKNPNESHRVRLRVEIGRLRKVLMGLAFLDATPTGYALKSERPVRLLLPLTDDDSARVGALLGDGAAWSAHELAEHAGVSKRTALRALASLVERGRVLRTGTAKETRYASATGRIASRMLLLGLAPTS
jgi:hypothetical protein